MDKPTFFDVVFLLIGIPAALSHFLTGSFTMNYAAPFCFCLVMYIFARKDLKDRIIPPSWWLVCVPLGALGLFTAGSGVVLIASLILAMVFFIMGYIGLLNGADALALTSMFCIFAGVSVAGIPVSFLILPATCLLGLLLVFCNPSWRSGMPALVPCSLCCVLALAV